MYPASQFFYQVPVGLGNDISEMVQEYDFWVFHDMASELKIILNNNKIK